MSTLLHLANVFHMTTPFDPLHGDGYAFVSGLGIGAAPTTVGLAWWKHRNCQVRWCWRIHLRRPTEGGHYVCKRHHPDHEGNRLSLDYIHEAHEIGGESPIGPAAARKLAKEETHGDTAATR